MPFPRIWQTKTPSDRLSSWEKRLAPEILAAGF